MRGHRLTALLAALSMLVLSACAGEEPQPIPTPSPAVSAAPAPEQEKTAFVLPCYPEAPFHPITGTSRTNLTLAPLVYEGLYELDEKFQPREVLCASAQADESRRTWTFTLRPGVTFSDGSPLTGAEAAASLRLAMGAGSPYAARLADVTGVTAGENTVTVTLAQANGALPALLDIPIIKETGATPLGTGPYVFAGAGETLHLEARSGWWKGAGLPLEQIPLYAVQGADGLIHAFDTREISLVSADITGANALGYSGSYETLDYATTSLLFIGYNAASGPCAETEVRRALSLAWERGAVAKSILSQHAAAAALPIPPASPLYSAALAQTLAYAPQTAAQILDDAGWKLEGERRVKGRGSLSLTFLVNTDNAYKTAAAEYLASGLAKLGVEVNLKKLPWEEYTAALAAGDFDLYLGETRLTADFNLSALVAPGGALNYGKFADAETQALLSAYLAAGEGGRAAGAEALCRRLGETAPFTPLCFKNWSVLTRWGKLSGLSPTQQNVFYHFEGWTMGQ